MAAPNSVEKLVKTFGNNLEFYKSYAYNEAQLRQEFLDPFFRELGWDMDNTAGLAPQYRDVIHEASIKIGGSTKAPDYAFSIHGQYKFFLEAKKPAVNVQQDADPAYQLRRYGWSAKLPISILTDFEEFAVYDCRKRPKRGEKASSSRLNYFSFTDYLDKWDELCETFSKDAILNGSFDKYTVDAKRHRGVETVDAAFLGEIENWRNLLARNFALRNPGLSVRDLNFAVQKTIDRLIFLRICEDRGTEDYKRLATLLNGGQIYLRLLEQFMQADARYNSGLFHFSGESGRGAPDKVTPNLSLDDAVLKEIFSKLYYPDSPYEFSVLPADILGQVYEQFLGKTIRLTPGHQAKIEEKPEVRKAGGVYYTPSYIVDYIVKNTLGRQLDGDDLDKPKPIALSKAAEIKVLDPACGSGSFLIVAYQYLLDWHLRQYTADLETAEPDEGKIKRHSGGKSPKIYLAPGEIWRLTTDERKRILLNNIHGVDIDAQAVEVTKLSLLLKVIEGETQQIKQRDWIRERQRILPDLGNNIQCGNSLIGPDFYDNEQMLLLEEETQYRINVFDWKTAFPEIMQRGGFDCVIGNPPYALVGRDQADEEEYYRSNFVLTAYKTNLYVLFLEKCLILLMPETSSMGLIIPKSLTFNSNFESTRHQLLSNYWIRELLEIREKVFEDAEVGDSLLIFGSKVPLPKNKICTYQVFETLRILTAPTFHQENKQCCLLERSGVPFFTDPLSEKCATSLTLGDIATVSNGLNPGNVRHILFSDQQKTKSYQRLVLGRDIHRFSLCWSGTWVNYDPELKNILTSADIQSKKGMTAQKKVDFALRDPEIYRPEKLLVRKTGDSIVCTYDPEGYYFDSLAYGIQIQDKQSYSIMYILGLLTSTLIDRVHSKISQNKGKVFAKVLATNLKKLPIRPIDFDIPADVAKHDKMVGLVERMLELNKKKADESNPNTLRLLETQLAATDRQIDRLVYDLYDLTEEEVKLVEQSNSADS